MIVHAYYPLGETRVEREAKALIDQGVEVDVISLRKVGEPALEQVDGIQVHRLPLRRRKSGGLFIQLLEYLLFFFGAFFRVAWLHFRKRYDVVQAHNLPDFLVFAALIPKIMGAKVILDIHDLMPEFYAERFNAPMNSFKVRLVLLEERLSCRFADFVITVTELWRERLIQRGVRADKISVVMNLADQRYFYPLPPDQRPAKSNDNFTLIYHGSFNKNYGMDYLILAVRIAREQIPNLRLILQGGGAYAEDLKALVKSLDLSDTIQVNHYILGAAELPAVIYTADIGVVPNYEGVFTGELLPTKLLEYVALGMPVLAARTRVISSYFDEKQVRFFAPGDEHSLAAAIVDAYEHRDELPLQVRELHRFTERYSWASMAAHYVGIVEKLYRPSDQTSPRKQQQNREAGST